MKKQKLPKAYVAIAIMMLIMIAMICLLPENSLKAGSENSTYLNEVQQNFNKAGQLYTERNGHAPNWTNRCPALVYWQLNAYEVCSKSDPSAAYGKDMAKSYANMGTTKMGYSLIGYPCTKDTAAATLDSIINTYNGSIRFLVVSFDPGNGLTNSAGHVMLISRIEDGRVYFADNTQYCRLSDGSYKAISMSIDEYKSNYFKWNANCITLAIKPGNINSDPFLNINVTQAPDNIAIGKAFGLRGTISSNTNLSEVIGYILDANGNIVQETHDYPNVTSVDIKPLNVNQKLLFDQLAEGYYTLRIVANSATLSNEYKKEFTVGNPPPRDTEPPIVANALITNVTANGYDVTCIVTDNVAVDRVQFPTWTSYNGQDDCIQDWGNDSRVRGTLNGNTATFHVNISDHNGESGEYITHIYAFDTSGNMSECAGVACTVPKKIVITSQPSSTTVEKESSASFNVKATGEGLKYLWQYKKSGASSWTDWTTKTTATISVAYASDKEGMKLRCVITDAYGNKATSNEATLTYKEQTTQILKHPVSTTVGEDEYAYFSVKASGQGIKYLWQYKEAGKSTWTDWTSKTTANISVGYALSRDGMSVRCVVTDSKGKKVTSNAATLTYNIPVSITKQPASTTVNANSAASFSVTAKGKGLKYLWQYKEAGKSTWTDWTTKTTASISVAYADYRDGMSFRCKVTDSTGKTVTSNAATLTYNKPLSITKQPASITVNANSAASFSVTATGKGLKYLWQYKEAGKTAWTDWTSKTTASISVAFADYRDGMSLRCVVTDASGKKVTSNTATLKYNYPLSITKQPVSTTVNANNVASFSVTASGKGLTYQWQYKEKGQSSWTSWTSKTTASISVAYADYRDGMSLRCIVKDASGKKVTSNEATLTYNIPLKITKQPASITVAKKKIACFNVKAEGKGLKYQWQYKNAGDTSWTDWTSKTTASIDVAYADYRNGMSVRCIVTDASGKKVTSNSATLTYK